VLSDGWTAVTRDRSLSAQFEHTIGVTRDGCEIFTLSPKGLDCTALPAAARSAPPDAEPQRTTTTATASACASASAKRRRRPARLRTAGAGAVPLHPAPRRQAAGQDADRPLRLLCRGAGRADRAAGEVEGVGESTATRPQDRRRRRQRMLKGEVRKRTPGVVLDRADRLLPRRHGLCRARGTARPLSRQEERPDRRRGAADRHRRPHAGLSARGRPPRAGTVGRPPSSSSTTTPRATPPPRRPTSA
jgi:hypothetical protein